MHDNFVVKSKYKDLNVDELYVLGPTSSGESYEKWIYPAFFFSINDKNVFINSHYDRFMNQKLCESVYMNHLEIRMLSSLDENLYWLIRVDGAGNVSVLTYHTEDYLGYDEVKEPSIFTAPVLRWPAIWRVIYDGKTAYERLSIDDRHFAKADPDISVFVMHGDGYVYGGYYSSRKNGIDMWRENEPVPVKSLINGKKTLKIIADYYRNI